MYSEIIAITRTREELEQLRDEIAVLKQSVFKTNETFDETLKNNVRLSVASVISEAIAKSGVSAGDFLDGLEVALNEFKTITLVISFKPRQKTIDILSSWARANLSYPVIFDFQYEPSLLAGVQIIYDGKFFDSSIEHLFEEKFTEISDYVYSKLG